MTDNQRLAWAILVDLSDRAGVPEWLGSKFDSAAVEIMYALVEIIEKDLAARSGGLDAG